MKGNTIMDNRPIGVFDSGMGGLTAVRELAALTGRGEGDEPQFDPGVLTEGDRTYLYTGFCWGDDPTRHGPMVTVLDRDMLTVIEGPNIIMPSGCYSSGSGYEGHEFFEASSIRKFGDTYYFVYSSVVMHELCYATSKYPDRGFKFGGVIVSNNDMGISTYKPAEKPMFYGANNHGGLVKVGDDYYIFYHRHTDGTNYSRQGMAAGLHARVRARRAYGYDAGRGALLRRKP